MCAQGKLFNQWREIKSMVILFKWTGIAYVQNYNLLWSINNLWLYVYRILKYYYSKLKRL